MAAAPELEPELGPEVEVTARAIPRIGAIAILTVCLGIILSIDAIVRGFFGTVSGAVGWIPYIGKVIEQPIHSIGQKIVSMLSGLEQDVDAALAHNIHIAARLFDKFIYNLEEMAATIVLLGALAAAAVDHYIVQGIRKWVRGQIRALESELHHGTRVVEHITKVIKNTIVHNVYPRVKAVTVAVPRFIHRDLLELRRDVNKAEHAATGALKRVESIPFPKTATTWATAVGLALAPLGLEWLRCESNPFKNNSQACGLWNDLKSLLGLLGDVILFANVCAFLDFASPFVSAAADVVIPALTDVGAGLCKGSIGPPPPLPDVNLSLPANPGVTLYLP